MAKTPKLYSRLPGTGAGGFQRARLWLGSDHLLLVGSSVIGERYKRFYFADIQALIAFQTRGWVVGMIVLLACAAGCAAIALRVDDSVLRGVFLGIAAVFLLVLGIHVALGPTCHCRIRTAVQTEDLPSLRRLRHFRKVLDRIRPLIESAQAPAAPADSLPS